MRCKNCNEEMKLIYKYRAKEFLESDEEVYKCSCCGAKVYFYENWEEWEGLKEDIKDFEDGYFDQVGIQVSNLIERR